MLPFHANTYASYTYPTHITKKVQTFLLMYVFLCFASQEF